MLTGLDIRLEDCQIIEQKMRSKNNSYSDALWAGLDARIARQGNYNLRPKSGGKNKGATKHRKNRESGGKSPTSS